MRRALPLLLVALALRPALAQCPNGTPPPCAGQRANPRLPSIAVLFMEPRSRNAADSLLAEGLTLEIINTLSGVARLDVKSRFFSRRIAAAADPMRSAVALGVDYVVDGVLELDSERVLVRGALTRTRTGRVVRGLSIERRRAELDAVQATVAQEMAFAVVGQLLPAERARFAIRRVDPRVTELLVRARALIQQYTETAARQALALARAATVADSTYAPAWTMLASCYGTLADFEPDSESFATQRVAANNRALALDSSNGLALMRLAAIRATQNDLSPQTEVLARRAAAILGRSEARTWVAYVVMRFGKVEESLTLVREATRDDSLSPTSWAALGFRSTEARHFADAANAWARALALRPSAQDSVWLRQARRWARLETDDCGGSFADAREQADTLLMVESLRCLGRRTDADSVMDGQLSSSTISPPRRAIYLAWRGQPDSAFAVLERAFPSHLGVTLQHPAFDPYRRHPAYLALRRRMGLQN